MHMPFNSLWRTPSPRELIARELDEAQRSLLEAQTGRDYANAMVSYHETRIERLRMQLEIAGQVVDE